MTTTLLAAALAVAGCTHGRDAGDAGDAEPASGTVELAEGEVGASVPFAWGNTVRGAGERGDPVELGAPISSVLVGTLAPAVVPDAAGARLLYNAWRGDRPVIRVHELTTGRDEELDDGAAAGIWRADGALAYFKADAPVFDDPARYRGHVVVRGPESESALWTAEQDRYVVAAWARQRLLAYRIGEGWPDLLVLDGPQRVRVLARESALVALSPDGRRALVFRRGTRPVVVSLLDLATGEEVAAARLPDEVEWLLESGSWTGEHAVASGSPGLVVLRVDGDAVELEQVLRFEAGLFRVGLHEPQVGEDGRVVAWGEYHARPGQVVEQAALVACDRLTLRCVHGPGMSVAGGPRLVYNPSRPLSGR